MSTESDAGSVNSASGNGAVNPNATSGVTAELKNEIQKIVMGIMKDAVPRAVKQAVTEAVPAALESIAGDAMKSAPQSKSDADGGTANDGRITMKALESQIKDLTQQIAKRDEALQQERQRAIDSQMRSEVRDALSTQIGADNPNLPFIMDSLFDARKRFVQQDGQTFVRFKAEYGGDDDHVPLKDGIRRLVEGELKHAIPSKTANLPPASMRVRGNPVASQPNGKRSALDEILSVVAHQAQQSPDNK